MPINYLWHLTSMCCSSINYGTNHPIKINSWILQDTVQGFNWLYSCTWCYITGCNLSQLCRAAAYIWLTIWHPLKYVPTKVLFKYFLSLSLLPCWLRGRGLIMWLVTWLKSCPKPADKTNYFKGPWVELLPSGSLLSSSLPIYGTS